MHSATTRGSLPRRPDGQLTGTCSATGWHPHSDRHPEDLARIRLLVTRTAHEAGLDSDRSNRLTLAANEIIANAIRHGVPPAMITIITTLTAIAVAVHDQGPGFTIRPAAAGKRPEDAVRDAVPPATRPPPDAEQVNGRGMRLARRLCDRLDVYTNSAGTTVTLTLYR